MATDEQLPQSERDLDTEILPGTEIMVDTEEHHHIKGNHGVLIPQPSDNPHDPLNWSRKWKFLAITASSSVSFTQGIGPLALGPAFGYYTKAFDCTLAEAISFTGVTILVLGFSNFIWVPLSTSFGRRFVYIVSQIICLASMIWRAKADTYGSFLGACILNGIGAGPAEAIQPAVIAAYMGSLMIGPIISGVMSDRLGWRSFWWLNVGFVGLSLLLVIFAFPETKFSRPRLEDFSTPGEDTQSDSNAPYPHEKLGAGRLENIELQSVDTGMKSQMPNLSHTATADRDPYLGKGYPSKSQWAIMQSNANPWKSMAQDFILPWKMFAFPIVEFAAFVASWSCSSFLSLNLTQAQVFAAPPYNFSSAKIGYFNIATFVGALIGLATAGRLSDWVAARATRKNHGIREPEMRLLAMIPYVIIMYVGNIVAGVGMDRKWPWQVIVIISFGAAGIQVAALPAIVSTYAVDCYKPVAGPLFVAITVNKNVWGYGFSKFVTEWVVEDGFLPPLLTNGSIVLFWCLFGILFYYKGKTFRRWYVQPLEMLPITGY
ncbi:serine/threonine kinase 16 [Aureobasidium sp. EXF-8846]|nr:serine/threonine kinase 16 [Aureobasidium sp. EXF-8846]